MLKSSHSPNEGNSETKIIHCGTNPLLISIFRFYLESNTDISFDTLLKAPAS